MAVINNSINNKVGGSNSGATNTLTVDNASNTASSQAQVNVTVGGTSAGDAYTTYTVSGTTNWSQGVDNSASDAFVLSASTALGTTNVMSAATGGAVSFVLGNVDVTKSASGADVAMTASNTSNTGSSTASNYLTVAGTSAGDARTQYAVSGTTTWTQGIDNSVTGDPFVLAASTALGTTNVMSAATTGEINYPLQPLVYAQVNDVAVNNVTGDGTVYTILFDDEQVDQGGDYDTSTGIFTVPVNGKYFISAVVGLAEVGALHTFAQMNINTTTHNQYISLNPGAIATSQKCGLSQSVILSLTATQTVKVTIQVSGSTKTVDVHGNDSGAFSFLSIMLVA